MSRILTAALLAISLLTLPACEAPGPKYRNVKAYSEGLAPVQHGNGRRGFVNERQEWVIAPKFDDAQSFQNGKAAVKQSNKWGFINRRGEWL
ncbi:MAG: WG repeat-containing protein [Rhodocyclales bacterium]|nr:WG repeat-containing protein [Rhodocyclales bacterium]